MITHKVLGLVVLLALPSWAVADEVAPGLWELSVEATVDAAPGFAPGPLTVNQCFTQADARDPGKMLAAITTPDANDCAYGEHTYSGNTFRFKLQCGGALHLQTTGEVTFSSAAVHGLMRTLSTINGIAVEFKSTISGRRLGDC